METPLSLLCYGCKFTIKYYHESSDFFKQRQETGLGVGGWWGWRVVVSYSANHYLLIQVILDRSWQQKQNQHQNKLPSCAKSTEWDFLKHSPSRKDPLVCKTQTFGWGHLFIINNKDNKVTLNHPPGAFFSMLLLCFTPNQKTNWCYSQAHKCNVNIELLSSMLCSLMMGTGWVGKEGGG